MYKSGLEKECYLNLNIPKYHPSLFAQFRAGILPLVIEVGRYRGLPYGWPKWTKSAKGSTYEKFHVRKHTRIKSFVYKTIRVSKVSCIK